MMANRHKAFKKGGSVKKVAYDAEKSNVMKEAKKKATGGKIETKATGGAAAPRLDKRARGGGTGKDMTKSPFSAAHFKTKGDA
jgi:hypothetical protein